MVFSTFGICGIHRFYLGKPVSGILYFVPSGFWALVKWSTFPYSRDG
ncbi:TM2 domain-containing protein [Acaryochloris sp. CCMEE 5410]|nr:TM2 domain-containing protein [Acaryochloris sp. CCMEE 5410]